MPLNPKLWKGWLEQLEAGQPLTFGFCRQEHQFTPAIIDAGPEGVLAACSMCGRSRDFGYEIYGDIPIVQAKRYEALQAIPAQIDWLEQVLSADIVAAEQHLESLARRADRIHAEKQEFSNRMSRLAEIRSYQQQAAT